MKSKDWKEEFEGRFVETYGRKNRKEWSLAYQPYEGLKELEDFISTLLEEARKEGRIKQLKEDIEQVEVFVLDKSEDTDRYWIPMKILIELEKDLRSLTSKEEKK